MVLCVHWVQPPCTLFVPSLPSSLLPSFPLSHLPFCGFSLSSSSSMASLHAGVWGPLTFYPFPPSMFLCSLTDFQREMTWFATLTVSTKALATLTSWVTFDSFNLSELRGPSSKPAYQGNQKCHLSTLGPYVGYISSSCCFRELPCLINNPGLTAKIHHNQLLGLWLLRGIQEIMLLVCKFSDNETEGGNQRHVQSKCFPLLCQNFLDRRNHASSL